MTRIMSALLGVLLTFALVVVPAATAGAEDGGVDTGKVCNDAGGEHGYKPNYKVKLKVKRPRLTHLQAHALPPTGKRSKAVTLNAEWARRLKVSVRFSTKTSVGLEASAKRLILAKAGVQIGTGLAGLGERTEKKSKTVTVTESYSNPTEENQDFVAFAGRTQVTGTFRYRYCWRYRRAEPATIHYRDGQWKSFTVRGTGLVRCGAGSGARDLTRLALKLGCQ